MEQFGWNNLGVQTRTKTKECEKWYRILVDSCGTQPDAIWDLLSNAPSREECFVDPKLPRRWGTRPGKLISLFGRDTLQRASQQWSARGPAMRDLFPPQWSAIAAREDAREQTWHTDVDKLPGTLPSNGELPGHLSMMLVLSDKYHLEVYLGSHLGDNDALGIEAFEFQRGGMVLFASTLRHRGLAALPGVGKQVVLIRFLTLDERHKRLDMERFVLDPHQGPRMSLLHGHAETGRCPTPVLSATRGSTSPLARDCRARSVCRGLSSWTTGLPLWVRQAPPIPPADAGQACPGRRRPHVARVRGGRRRPLDKRAIMARPG